MEGNAVNWQINPDSPVAQYQQIENLVRADIAAGRLKPGDTLPSVRDAAATLGVNPNTVTKAYRDLLLTGVIVSRRGVGSVVTENAAAVRRAARVDAELALKDALARCVSVGMTSEEIFNRVDHVGAALA
jgi:GntR family transcriptional regulator